LRRARECGVLGTTSLGNPYLVPNEKRAPFGTLNRDETYSGSEDEH
jgi:hypothetical protein